MGGFLDFTLPPNPQKYLQKDVIRLGGNFKGSKRKIRGVMRDTGGGGGVMEGKFRFSIPKIIPQKDVILRS